LANAGRREFIQVLRLMEDFHQHQVEQAVAAAIKRFWKLDYYDAACEFGSEDPADPA
jgi:uncharacterized protein DUF3768